MASYILFHLVSDAFYFEDCVALWVILSTEELNTEGKMVSWLLRHKQIHYNICASYKWPNMHSCCHNVIQLHSFLYNLYGIAYFMV